MRTLSLSLLVLVGCSSGGPDPDPEFEFDFAPPSRRIELQLSSAPVDLLPPASIEVPLVLSRVGVEGPVKLAALGVPAGVEVTFAASEVEDDSTRIRIAASKEAGEGLFPVQVVAQRGEARGSAVLVLRVGRSTWVELRGRVVDWDGQPVADRDVAVGSATAKTGADGSFTIAGLIEAPYDAAIRFAPRVFHVYRGLTSPRPVLQLLPLTRAAPKNTASILGTLSGGAGFPSAGGEKTLLGFAAELGWGSRFLGRSQGPNYQLEASWYGPGSTRGKLYGLQVRYFADRVVASYSGFAEREVSVEANRQVSANLVFEPVESSYLTGEAILPRDYVTTKKSLWLTFGPRSAMPLQVDTNAGDSFGFTTPIVPLALGVEVEAQKGRVLSYRYVANLTPSEAIKLILPAAATPNAPGVGSTANLRTEFSWSGPTNAVHTVTFVASGLAVAVYTDQSTTLFPEARALGLELPRGATFSWSVSSTGPHGSIDTFARAQGGLGFIGLDRDLFVTYSEARSFSTAP